jgi:hypothetical protein
VRRKRVAPVISRHFGWLEPLGYNLLEASDSWGPTATYARGELLVRPSYEYRDEYADVTVARRQKEDLREEPYWAQVHLDELLHERAPSAGPWRGESIDEAFARGADLLREHAADLLAGENLNVLDEIVAKRPHLGFPASTFLSPNHGLCPKRA